MEGVNIIEKFLPAPKIGQLLSFISFFSFISLPGKHYLSLELVNFGQAWKGEIWEENDVTPNQHLLLILRSHFIRAKKKSDAHTVPKVPILEKKIYQ